MPNWADFAAWPSKATSWPGVGSRAAPALADTLMRWPTHPGLSDLRLLVRSGVALHDRALCVGRAAARMTEQTVTAISSTRARRRRTARPRCAINANVELTCQDETLAVWGPVRHGPRSDNPADPEGRAGDVPGLSCARAGLIRRPSRRSAALSVCTIPSLYTIKWAGPEPLQSLTPTHVSRVDARRGLALKRLDLRSHAPSDLPKAVCVHAGSLVARARARFDASLRLAAQARPLVFSCTAIACAPATMADSKPDATLQSILDQRSLKARRRAALVAG